MAGLDVLSECRAVKFLSSAAKSCDWLVVVVVVVVGRIKSQVSRTTAAFKGGTRENWFQTDKGNVWRLAGPSLTHKKKPQTNRRPPVPSDLHRAPAGE